MLLSLVFFFFNDTATTEIYTLSLHDALPISDSVCPALAARGKCSNYAVGGARARPGTLFDLSSQVAMFRSDFARDRTAFRSEEHTSELQSQSNIVCRLLLEKKNE